PVGCLQSYIQNHQSKGVQSCTVTKIFPLDLRLIGRNKLTNRALVNVSQINQKVWRIYWFGFACWCRICENERTTRSVAETDVSYSWCRWVAKMVQNCPCKFKIVK